MTVVGRCTYAKTWTADGQSSTRISVSNFPCTGQRHPTKLDESQIENKRCNAQYVMVSAAPTSIVLAAGAAYQVGFLPKNIRVAGDAALLRCCPSLTQHHMIQWMRFEPVHRQARHQAVIVVLTKRCGALQSWKANISKYNSSIS